ncbi:hypothetical protein GR140_18875 [Pseudomonas putida]|uniref:hypothetical protein n=1 Tax=Pseudomonas putida TaxID=303 RepID=UPI001BAE8622|nr:hypothetical protein [Pseudomonas putida]QUG90729.1 hypothetical protein GR140_18875 [Pseudomonas putida]
MNDIIININAIFIEFYMIAAIAMLTILIFYKVSESTREVFKLAGIPFMTCLVLCFAIYAPDGTIKNAIDSMEEFNNREQEMVRAFGVLGMFLPHRDIENNAYTKLKNKTMEEL